MAYWEKRTLKLPANHGWRCKDGYKVFVADRGALRLDCPEDWIIIADKQSVKFHDKQPPDDNCVLEVSYIPLPRIDWSGLSLARLLLEVNKADIPNVTEDQIVRVTRADLELVWLEHRFLDPGEKRDAISRMCMARTVNTHVAAPRPGKRPVAARPDIQALLTLAFWPEDREWVDPVWQEVLRSLQLGVMMQSPTGHVLH